MKVELSLAWVWDCDTCGRENFCRAEIATREEVVTAIEEQLAEDGDELDPDLVDEIPECGLKPFEVTCKHCGAKFEVEEDLE